jgi:hypothetical protein
VVVGDSDYRRLKVSGSSFFAFVACIGVDDNVMAIYSFFGV